MLQPETALPLPSVTTTPVYPNAFTKLLGKRKVESKATKNGGTKKGKTKKRIQPQVNKAMAKGNPPSKKQKTLFGHPYVPSVKKPKSKRSRTQPPLPSPSQPSPPTEGKHEVRSLSDSQGVQVEVHGSGTGIGIDNKWSDPADDVEYSGQLHESDSFSRRTGRGAIRYSGRTYFKKMPFDFAIPEPNSFDLPPLASSFYFWLLDIEQQTEYQTQEPYFLLFGVYQNRRIAIRVNGFYPYCFISGASPAQVRQVLDLNNVEVKSIGISKRTSMMGHNQPESMVKVAVRNPNLIPKVRGLFPNNYDSALRFPLRFMIDKEIYAASWVKVTTSDPSGLFTTPKRPQSRCDYEITIQHEEISSVSPAEVMKAGLPELPAVRVLSFDIECAGKPNRFPNAQEDPIICISGCLVNEKAQVLKNCIWSLKPTNPVKSIDGEPVEDKWFQSERDLLVDFFRFWVEVDPDFMSGWNINNFDLPYLLKRCEILGIKEACNYSRLARFIPKCRDGRFESKAVGFREQKETRVPGCIEFDLLKFVRGAEKLRRYALDEVSYEFLGLRKEDVHYSQITQFHHKSADHRMRLAHYCLVDSRLPMLIMGKKQYLLSVLQMARISGVPIKMLLDGGQTITMLSMICRASLKSGFVVPYRDRDGEAEEDSEEETYKGATVMDPLVGFYTDSAVICLDLQSLYPSIMIAYNLCFTTAWLPGSTGLHPSGRKITEDDCITTPTDEKSKFIKKNVKEGIVPRVLQDLLAERKKVKEAMKTESDAFRKQCLNRRQEALKIRANSGYGMLGFRKSLLYCPSAAASVTAYGRKIIERAKQIVEGEELKEHLRREAGRPIALQVLYGDTDSLMINTDMNFSDYHFIAKVSWIITKFVNEIIAREFSPVICFAFEKILKNFFLAKKKNYAAVTLEFDKEHGLVSKGMLVKGMQSVRRDSCRFIKDTLSQVLEYMIVENDLKSAFAYIKQRHEKLQRNAMDLSQLIISKSLRAKYKKTIPAHARLAERMRQRDPENYPQPGDRILFVYVACGKKEKISDFAEDPLMVHRDKLAVNTRQYLKLFESTVDRVLNVVGTSVSALCPKAGRIIRASLTGVGKYFHKKERHPCFSCRASDVAQCTCASETKEKARQGKLDELKVQPKVQPKQTEKHPVVDVEDLYPLGFTPRGEQTARLLSRVTQTEKQLWEICVKCQGCTTRDLLSECTAAGCENLFVRQDATAAIQLLQHRLNEQILSESGGLEMFEQDFAREEQADNPSPAISPPPQRGVDLVTSRPIKKQMQIKVPGSPGPLGAPSAISAPSAPTRPPAVASKLTPRLFSSIPKRVQGESFVSHPAVATNPLNKPSEDASSTVRPITVMTSASLAPSTAEKTRDQKLPRVVCLKREGDRIVQNCDIYIGRAWNTGGWSLPQSKWHNPFTIASCQGSAQRAVVKYESYLRNSPVLLGQLAELSGKTLGCWCKKTSSDVCHGDVLIKLFRELQR